MGCFVVAEFLLISASRGPSAIAEPLVLLKSTAAILAAAVFVGDRTMASTSLAGAAAVGQNGSVSRQMSTVN